MSGKPKLAMYWAASCGGCEIAVLNTHEKILDIDAGLDVVFWPVAMDAKYHDVEAMPDGAITLTLFNGGMRNSENEEIARLLRRKSKLLVAFGSCACEGCIPGLANLSSRQDVIDTAYSTVSTENPSGVRPEPRWMAPEGELRIPSFHEVLRPLDYVVPVDYYMPGCPPESHQIAAVLDVVLAALRGEAELPPAGTVLGVASATVCDECVRTRGQKAIKRFVRIQDARFDPDECLLEQGLPCNGPATRGGCGAKCPSAGAQCMGCYGAAADVDDFGARMVAALGSVVDSNDPAEIEQILDGIPDPVGQFYRFSLPGSILGASRRAWDGS